MFQFIENLRQKPDSVKSRVAFLISFFISGVIFTIWLSVIFPDFKNNQKIEETEKTVGVSPVSTFSDTFSSGFTSLGEQINNIKESVGAMFSAPIYYSATSTATQKQ
ncbi:MAG: hypothetical protein ABL899_00695 [Nitrospira sp.]